MLTGGIAVAALLTWIIPAGRYDRAEHAATGRMAVVPGTYHAVEATPVGPFDALVAIPRGMIEAADVIFLVLLAGAAFLVVDRTGVLRRSTSWLAARLAGRGVLVIPIVSLLFAAGGALNNMQEEIIPLVPVLLILFSRLGFDAVVVCAVSVGAAAIGAAFSPFNPFQVLIAQRLAELPPGSGWQLRLVFLVIALVVWVWLVMRYAAGSRTREAGSDAVRSELSDTTSEWSALPASRFPLPDVVILAIVAATFLLLAVGMLRWHWDFTQIAALFFVMGALAGLAGRLGVTGTASAFADGFGAMAYAGALIGFARAIFVVLNDGAVIDSIVRGIFTPLEGLPAFAALLAMMVAHVGIHVPVPSVSGHAVLTMPILVPLSDLAGISRQATVMAYHYGAGLTDLVTPTNGALLAILGAAGVGYDRWLRFLLPRILAMLAIGALALAIAVR